MSSLEDNGGKPYFRGKNMTKKDQRGGQNGQKNCQNFSVRYSLINYKLISNKKNHHKKTSKVSKKWPQREKNILCPHMQYIFYPEMAKTNRNENFPRHKTPKYVLKRFSPVCDQIIDNFKGIGGPDDFLSNFL